MFNRQLCWPISLLVPLLLLPGRAEDAFARPGLVVNWMDTPLLRFQTYTELQVADSEPHFNRWIQAERFTVKPWDRLWLGVNHTLTERFSLDPATRTEFALDEHRLELEAAPRLSFGESVRLTGRIRMEHRWKENAPDDWRFRMRWEPSLAVKDCGPLSDVFVQAEYLHELKSSGSREWRIVPAGTHWRFNDHLSLRVYYMWDTVRARPDWTTSHILYTTWQWSL